MKFKPFDYPEVTKLMSELFDSLFNESGRGALLIATAHADKHLTELIKAVFPNEMSKDNREKNLQYPGPLASFSAKIDLAYAFRLIDKNLFNSLNALRKIRNDAAHSPNSFELHELNEKIKIIYANIGDGVVTFLREVSIEAMMYSKKIGWDSLFAEYNWSDEQKREHISILLSEPENIKKLEKQVPFWELMYGLGLICGLMAYQKEKIINLTSKIRTWSSLSKSEET